MRRTCQGLGLLVFVLFGLSGCKNTQPQIMPPKPPEGEPEASSPGDFAGQVRATWENMRRIMAKAGGSLDDIVTMTVYTTERRWSEMFTDMRKDVFKTGYPSSAFVEARKLRTPGAFLEIQAIAVLKE